METINIPSDATPEEARAILREYYGRMCPKWDAESRIVSGLEDEDKQDKAHLNWCLQPPIRPNTAFNDG